MKDERFYVLVGMVFAIIGIALALNDSLEKECPRLSIIIPIFVLFVARICLGVATNLRLQEMERR